MKPIDLEFDLNCSPEHAFRIWTERAGLWWPRSHTHSGAPDLEVVFEPHPGGRIYERAPDGTEYDWGEVAAWEPPHRIAYFWHIFFDREEATDVTVTFEPTEEGTKVRLHQDGFDRLPEDVGRPRRDRTEGAWSEITGHYRRAVESG